VGCGGPLNMDLSAVNLPRIAADVAGK